MNARAMSTDTIGSLSVADRLARLEDLEAARDVLAAYAAAVDCQDVGGLRTVYRGDSVMITPRATYRGFDEIAGFFLGAWERDPWEKRHFVTNVATEWLSPGWVSVRAYFLFTGRPSDRSVIGWGTYHAKVNTEGSPVLVEHELAVSVGTSLVDGWAEKGVS